MEGGRGIFETQASWTMAQNSGIINHGPTRVFEEPFCKLMPTSDSGGNLASKYAHFKDSLAGGGICLFSKEKDTSSKLTST